MHHLWDSQYYHDRKSPCPTDSSVGQSSKKMDRCSSHKIASCLPSVILLHFAIENGDRVSFPSFHQLLKIKVSLGVPNSPGCPQQGPPAGAAVRSPFIPGRPTCLATRVTWSLQQKDMEKMMKKTAEKIVLLAKPSHFSTCLCYHIMMFIYPEFTWKMMI